MTDLQSADRSAAPQIAIVGDFARTDFAPVLSAASTLAGPEHLQAFGTISSLLAEGRDPGVPRRIDMLVILQSWPDQFSENDVFDLLDRYPLARWIVCCGPWCDSDGRTRSVWPLPVRVPISQAPVRLQQEWRICRGEDKPQPLTASRDETYLFDFVRTSLPELPHLALEVRTPDPAIKDLFAALLRSGHGSVSETPRARPNLIIWDVDPWTPDVGEQIANSKSRQPDIPILALAGFARDHEIAQMKQAGAKAVLAKTAPVHQYLSAISQLAHQTAGHRPHFRTPLATMMSSAPR